MGYTADGILIAATTDKMTTGDFSMKYLDHCTAWINLDGGSTTVDKAGGTLHLGAQRDVVRLCVDRGR